MKVIAGKHRGRKINTVDDKKLRPTTGMAREAVFNILTHGKFRQGNTSIIDGAHVLDLFCGCGALAMESLSRGAQHVTLIDIDPAHLNVAKRNIETIKETPNTTFLRHDSSNPPLAPSPCSLVFIDPPYGKSLPTIALKRLQKNQWLEEGCVIVVETGKKEELSLPNHFEELDNRVYGNSRIRILQWHCPTS